MQGIATHPLSEFFRAIIREYDRGLKKYGPWEEISSLDQAEAIRSEYNEWIAAYLTADIHGEHGEIAELTHLVNCCIKRWEYLKKHTARKERKDDL